MTNNWQDKYKDLKVGESAWYWHKNKHLYPVTVTKWISMQDGSMFLTGVSVGGSTCTPIFTTNPVTEDFPNGPRCMTPEEIEKLLTPKKEVELPNAEVYQELEDSIVECKIPTPMPEWLEKQLDIVSDTVSK